MDVQQTFRLEKPLAELTRAEALSVLGEIARLVERAYGDTPNTAKDVLQGVESMLFDLECYREDFLFGVVRGGR